MKTAKTIWKKFRGLMFRKEPVPMLFVFGKPGKHSFHTFFMRFPIDIVFFDEKKRIVEVHENVRPWRFVMPKADFSYALELPVGGARNIGTKGLII